MRVRSAFASLCVAGFALLSLGSCGGGGKELHVFVLGQVVGPSGGTVETETVRLFVPPGGFDEDVVVAILPDTTLFPIDPAAGAVEYMPGIMCIGPIGLEVLNDARVRMYYLESDIPLGSLESDLVLLEWDDVAGLMRVSATAVLDALSNCLEDDVYGFLGHIAVGVLTQRAPVVTPMFLFPGDTSPAALPGRIETLGAPLPQSPILLHLVSRDDQVPPAFALNAVEGTNGAQDFLPSHGIATPRVLFSRFDPQTKQSTLFTADWPVEPSPSRVVAPPGTFTHSDPLFGWLGDQDAVYIEGNAPVSSLGTTSTRAFRSVPGSGTPPPDPIAYLNPGFLTFLQDVRISPDGTMALLRYISFNQGTITRFDVVDAADGAPVGTDLFPTLDQFSRMPRWLPDSSALYYVDPGGLEVRQVALDGTDTLLYTIGDVPQAILDFVVSPDYDPGDVPSSPCAYVLRTFNLVVAEGLGPFGDDLVVDVLDGGQAVDESLFGFFLVNEMAWRPDGSGVILDLEDESRNLVPDAFSPTGGIPLSSRFLHFADAQAVEQRRINATMDDLDVDRDGGEILLWIAFAQQDDAFPEAGIHLLDFEDAGDTLIVPANPPTGVRAFGPPRFVRSWRYAPGFGGAGALR